MVAATVRAVHAAGNKFYDLDYDDGDKEERVPEQYVKLPAAPALRRRPVPLLRRPRPPRAGRCAGTRARAGTRAGARASRHPGRRRVDRAVGLR